MFYVMLMYLILTDSFTSAHGLITLVLLKGSEELDDIFDGNVVGVTQHPILSVHQSAAQGFDTIPMYGTVELLPQNSPDQKIKIYDKHHHHNKL